MQKISTTSELRAAIVQLELKQETQGKQLKEQFYATYESFKTINLFKKVLIEVATSPGLMSGMINTVVELTQHKNNKHNNKDVSDSATSTIFRSLLKTGVMKLVVENSDTLLLFGQYIIKRLFQHKEKKHKGND
jgi:hypothetical protein